MTLPDPDPVADALAALHPPHDPNDITTWTADQLDELALWQAAVDGLEVIDHPDEIALLTDPANTHGANTEDEMTATGDDAA